MSKSHGKKRTFHHRPRNTNKHGNETLFDEIDDWLRRFVEDALASVGINEDTEDVPEEPVDGAET